MRGAIYRTVRRLHTDEIWKQTLAQYPRPSVPYSTCVYIGNLISTNVGVPTLSISTGELLVKLGLKSMILIKGEKCILTYYMLYLYELINSILLNAEFQVIVNIFFLAPF